MVEDCRIHPICELQYVICSSLGGIAVYDVSLEVLLLLGLLCLVWNPQNPMPVALLNSSMGACGLLEAMAATISRVVFKLPFRRQCTADRLE
eukprot:5868529-Amphidinium_carterae.1